MSHNSVEQKPSETALFAALRRTIANKEDKNRRFGPDDLAEYCLPPHLRFCLKFEAICTKRGPSKPFDPELKL